MTLSFLSLPYEVQLKIIDHFTRLRDIENIIDAVPQLIHTLSSRLYESIFLLNVKSMDDSCHYHLLNLYFAREKHIVRLGHENCFVEGPVKKITFKKELAQRSYIRALRLFLNFCKLNKDHLQELQELEIRYLDTFSKIRYFKIPAELTNLKVLNLEGNKLKRIPGLDHLKNLQELYLAMNQISNLSSLPPLPSLSKLDLSFNPLGKLKGKKINCTNLKQLIAKSAILTSVDEIGHLKNLEVVDFSKNKIKSLKGFKDIPKLEKLDLSHNCLEPITFPDELKSLKELDLSFNKICTISNLSIMSKMRSLKLIDCGLESIDGLNNLKYLETLSLELNYFSLIRSRRDWSLKKLKNLDICRLRDSFGHEVQLPAITFDGFPRLETLSFGYSQILVDPRFAMLRKLKKLSCHRVFEIENLPPSVEVLDFSYSAGLCKLRGFSKMINLRELQLRRTEISKIENLEQARHLEVLNLEGCSRLSKIEALDNLQCLTVLNASGSKISKIAGLTKLVNLKELNLSSCQIKSMEGLNTLIKLEKLVLNHNSIRKIKGLENCTCLTTLDLAFNKISKIKGLENCTCLMTLDLGKNKITKLEGLDYCTKLRGINLYSNPITEIKGLDFLTDLYFLNIDYQRLAGDERLKLSKMNGRVKVFHSFYKDNVYNTMQHRMNWWYSL